ncbi:hypothetical protein PhCBS80983_g01794 [Powellomyces hirtus]|uniref:Letm1 RBD domain-containing protein n=1 Tax=Powellomyces hirtus TaxID=109895 RepID=A0A507E8I5_9FUNG|nr:hypothetical protein PhCBS80983_g01794 [Powellomyces hirtus]
MSTIVPIRSRAATASRLSLVSAPRPLCLSPPPRTTRTLFQRTISSQSVSPVPAQTTLTNTNFKNNNPPSNIQEALDSSPAPPSLIRRWWDASIAGPASILLTGLGYFWNGSMESLQMYTDHRQKGVVVKDRAKIIHLQRNKRDLLRIFPAALYLAVPLAIPLLPYMFRVAPNFMPTVFVTEDILWKKLRAVEKRRSALAPKLLAAFDNAIETSVSKEPTPQAKQLAQRWKQLRGNPTRNTETQLISLQILMRDHASLVSAPTSLIRIMARFVGLGMHAVAPQSRLFTWIDWIIKDDKLLRAQGVNSLTDYELREALDERGFINLSQKTIPELRNTLSQHLKFTKHVTETIVPRSRAAHLRSGSKDALVEMPADEIASMASMILIARALQLHGPP